MHSFTIHIRNMKLVSMPIVSTFVGTPYYITHARTFERAYLGARIYIIRYTSKTRSFKSLQVLKEY